MRMRRRKFASERAVPHVRKVLGERLRDLRKQRGLSQEALGRASMLSGKFIGEVERGEKSISVDSLYHVASALRVPLWQLTDVQMRARSDGPSKEAERIYALVSGHRRPADIKRAHEVLRAILSRG
jgi:transcriptional regulator with XRE-family HTH domain